MFLDGYHFVVIIVYQALKWLNSIESPSGRIPSSMARFRGIRRKVIPKPTIMGNG